MPTKKYGLQPAPGARAQSRRGAERRAACDARKDPVLAGAHKQGTAPRADPDIARADALNAFTRRGTDEPAPRANAVTRLRKVF